MIESSERLRSGHRFDDQVKDASYQLHAQPLACLAKVAPRGVLSPSCIRRARLKTSLIRRSVSTPIANTIQSVTRCDNPQARSQARSVSKRACSITACEITLLRPASRSKMLSASGDPLSQLPCLLSP